MCLLEGQRERHCTPDWKEVCDSQEYTAICSILKRRDRVKLTLKKDVKTPVHFRKHLLIEIHTSHKHKKGVSHLSFSQFYTKCNLPLKQHQLKHHILFTDNINRSKDNLQHQLKEVRSAPMLNIFSYKSRACQTADDIMPKIIQDALC